MQRWWRSARVIYTVVLTITALIVAWTGDRRAPADATRPISLVGRKDAALTPTEDEISIASFNIHGCKGTDGSDSWLRVASLLQNSDIAALYEVHSTPWGPHANQAEQIATWLRARSIFVPTEHRWWHDHFGNAMISRKVISSCARIPLPREQSRAYRCAMLTRVPLKEGSLQILAVHVDSREDRVPQLQLISELFLGLETPSVLMGDLNSEPGDPVMETLLQRPGVVDVRQCVNPSELPEAPIDWMLARGLECLSADFFTNEASDHPIVRARFRIPGQPQAPSGKNRIGKRTSGPSESLAPDRELTRPVQDAFRGERSP